MKFETPTIFQTSAPYARDLLVLALYSNTMYWTCYVLRSYQYFCQNFIFPH